jgi:hypothetical protein
MIDLCNSASVHARMLSLYPPRDSQLVGWSDSRSKLADLLISIHPGTYECVVTNAQHSTQTSNGWLALSVLRYIRHKEHRRAVGTHYGPTRMHRADHRSLQATPSEGRRSWHYDTILSPQLPPGCTDHRKTTGRAALLEDGHRRRHRRSAGPFRDNGPEWPSGRIEPE